MPGVPAHRPRAAGVTSEGRSVRGGERGCAPPAGGVPLTERAVSVAERLPHNPVWRGPAAGGGRGREATPRPYLCRASERTRKAARNHTEGRRWRAKNAQAKTERVP